MKMIGTTDLFLKNHDAYKSLMEAFLDIKRVNFPEAISVVNDVSNIESFKSLIEFCEGIYKSKSARTLAIMTGIGDEVPNHIHETEDAILYYINGGRPLKYVKESTVYNVSIKPGGYVLMPSKTYHSVQPEIKTRYCVGVLFDVDNKS